MIFCAGRPSVMEGHTWILIAKHNSFYTGLVKIMLTLLRTVVSSIPREMCVLALNGTVARWLLCVKHDGEQVETVL